MRMRRVHPPGCPCFSHSNARAVWALVSALRVLAELGACVKTVDKYGATLVPKSGMYSGGELRAWL